ncbi:carbon starvation CstA family protein [Bacillus licheniformis]|nr:carbon starvation CstA family protein [Bacillus licheniformis]
MAGVFIGPSIAETPLGDALTLDTKRLLSHFLSMHFCSGAACMAAARTARLFEQLYEIGVFIALIAGFRCQSGDSVSGVYRVHGRRGPVSPGPVWPFISITIACGAISGFHAFVGSGTTPKMLDKWSDMKFVGFGAMLVECLVGIMALIAATALQPGDYLPSTVRQKSFGRLA